MRTFRTLGRIVDPVTRERRETLARRVSAVASRARSSQHENVLTTLCKAYSSIWSISMAFVFRVTILRHKDKLKYFSFLLFSHFPRRRYSFSRVLFVIPPTALSHVCFVVYGTPYTARMRAHFLRLT